MRVGQEEPRRRLVGLGLHDRVAGELVADIRDALRRDALGLAERRAAVDDRLAMGLDPLEPRLHAFLLPRLALLRVWVLLLVLLERRRVAGVDRHELLHHAS